jgi:uncharacterized protein (TIRG00374 family)
VLLFLPFALTADWEHALSILRNAQPLYLALYLLATAIIVMLLALRWHIITHASNISVKYPTQLSYQLARFAVSFVTPGPRVGGDAVAAGLLTRHKNGKNKARFSDALSTLALDRAVEVQTFSVLFFFGVLYFSVTGSLPVGVQVPLILISVAYLALAGLVAAGFARGKFFLTGLVKRFAKQRKTVLAAENFERSVMRFYRAQPRAFLLATGVSAVAWLVSLVEYTAALRLLGFSMPLWGVFIVFSFVGFAYLVPIPLALGSLETAQATAFSLVGLPSVGGLLLAFLIRARDGTLALIGFLILASNGFNYKKFA